MSCTWSNNNLCVFRKKKSDYPIWPYLPISKMVEMDYFVWEQHYKLNLTSLSHNIFQFNS